MRTLPLLLASLSLAACVANEDPPVPNIETPDAAEIIVADAAPEPDAPLPPDAAPGPSIVGRVCVTEDWRPPLPCAAIAIAGTKVRIEGTSTIVNVDSSGNFTLPVQPTRSTVTLVAVAPADYLSGAIVAKLDGDGAAKDLRIPITSEAAVSAMVDGSNATRTEGKGIAVLYPTLAGAPVTNGVFTPIDGKPALYPTIDANIWVVGPPDESRGAVTFFDLTPAAAAAGNVQVAAKPHDFTVPVIADAVTFHTLDF